jgi:hypothetical protein
MKRSLLLCVAALVLPTSAAAQDRIQYADRAARKDTVSTASGTIQDENAGAVVYKPGAAATTKEIPAADIIDILYEVPGGVRIDYGRANAEEKKASDQIKEDARKKALTDLLTDYQKIFDQLRTERYRFAKRHLQFKIARLRAQLAEEDPEVRDQAITALTEFKKENPDSWQITLCAKLLARLQLAKGDTGAAQKTYEELAATPNLAKRTRQECDLLVAGALIEARKYTDAQSKLDALLRELPADDPQATRVRLYSAQCRGASGKLEDAVKEIQGLIDKTSDKELLALSYNALGDCYRLNNKPKEAIWPYLMVDVVYHQDRQQHARAVEHLAKLFEEQGDKEYARRYKESLAKLRK